MKRFLIPFLFISTFPVQANVDPEIRKACLKAVDFEGCVNAFTKPKSSREVVEYDILGKPVIKGWIKHEANNSVWYWRPQTKQVKVRGAFGRYIIRDVVQRWYVGPRAGTSSQTYNLGSYSTSCSDYYGAITCQTSPPQTLTIPGRSSFSGGVLQHSYSLVVDCKDRTFRHFGNPKYFGMGWRKWKKVSTNMIAGDAVKWSCYRIDSLEKSTFSKLAN